MDLYPEGIYSSEILPTHAPGSGLIKICYPIPLLPNLLILVKPFEVKTNLNMENVLSGYKN